MERISKDDLTETPTTAEALDGAAKATGSDIAYKLSHLLALVVAGVIALLASAALADGAAATLSRRPASLSPHRCVPSPAGRSVIKLKDTSNLPRLTALTATLAGRQDDQPQGSRPRLPRR